MKFRSLCFALTILSCCGCSNDQANTQHNQTKFLAIAAADDPLSLDPRLVRDLSSSTVMRMLYEGLLSTSFNGKIVPGIAEGYTISNDKKTYTFHLRPSTWMDGSPLTAHDFEATWKSVLNPAFPAPNAYQLYVIKGAKAAKEGRASVDDIGIQATDDQTLIVELEQPAPYFIDMVSCHFFFPVHKSARDLQSGSSSANPIGNGPFKLDNWTKRSELLAVKNPLYWDQANVSLPGVSLQVLDEHTALQLFKAGELDWIGSPLSTLPQDSVATLKQQNLLQISKGSGTHWFRLNTSKPPFNNQKMRQAFAQALNRKDIIEHITQGNQQPAIGIIPPSFGLTSQKYYSDNNIASAQELFNEALAEEKLAKSELPTISISYASNDRNHKIAQAVQQQWNAVFGIDVALNGNESQMQMDKVKTGNYQIAMGSWYADIQDPINFLEIFKSKENPTNQTFWENQEYTNLLSQSSLELDSDKRKGILSEAEKILVEEMPVISVFHSAYNYLKNDQVEKVYFSPLGYLDFKLAEKQ